MEALICWGHQLTALTKLMCDGNHLSTLDITPCTLLELKEITCGNQGQTPTLYVTQAQNDGSSLIRDESIKKGSLRSYDPREPD